VNEKTEKNKSNEENSTRVLTTAKNETILVTLGNKLEAAQDNEKEKAVNDVIKAKLCEHTNTKLASLSLQMKNKLDRKIIKIKKPTDSTTLTVSQNKKRDSTNTEIKIPAIKKLPRIPKEVADQFTIAIENYDKAEKKNKKKRNREIEVNDKIPIPSKKQKVESEAAPKKKFERQKNSDSNW